MIEPTVSSDTDESLDSARSAVSHAESRRWLLRGGVLAAGAAVVAAAMPSPAQAADGDPTELGAENEATSTTGIRIGADAGGPSPALALYNADGPSLFLQSLPYEFAPELQEGEIVNTEIGPLVGVTGERGLETTYVATGVDLDAMPTPYALPRPARLLDTRNPAKRTVLRSSSGAFDSQFRLRPGAWVDVEVIVAGREFDVQGAYVNLTATGSPTGGYLSVYPPHPTFPGTSTLNFAANQTLANAAFVGTGIVLGRFAIRVRASATTHVVLDLTGVTVLGNPGVPVAAAARAATRGKRPARTARLRTTLNELVRSALAR